MDNDLTLSSLRGDWRVLETEPVAQLASLPVAGQVEGDIRIAVDGEGSRHLLLRTSLQPRPWTAADAPLRDCVVALTFAGTRSHFLDVRCSNPLLYDIFDELIVDVLTTAIGDTDLGASVDASLERWRAMFRGISAGLFGKQRRYGLFAELTVLETCISLMGEAALEMWTGPTGTPHDFELPRGCIEVKAIGQSSTEVTVHGLHQLEVDRGQLSLLVHSLAESPAGRTIRELVADIELKVGPGALESSLTRVGFTPSSADERLSVVDSFAVGVTGQLPSLTPSTVSPLARDGLSRVEYDIPLATLVGLSEKTESAQGAIAKMCS